MSRVPEGTPFQMAVWAELLRIPRGEVRTYTQIAAAIGRPPAPALGNLQIFIGRPPAVDTSSSR